MSATGLIGYGSTLFCSLPIAIGITTGILPDKKGAIFGGILAMIIFLTLLIMGHIEGFICVLMAVPIIAILLFTGYLMAYIINKVTKKRTDKFTISFFIPSLLFFVSCGLEYFAGDSSIKSEVTNSIIISDSPSEVYRKIINVDTVDVEKTVYQKLGLPTPRKCILTEEKIGGQRICQFEEGVIIEIIKDFKKNEFLKMKITKSDMLGFKWLSFNEDIYIIEKIGAKTKITRTTTYYSDLKPRFYWQAIENLTISSEQDFVFRNLRKDLSKND